MRNLLQYLICNEVGTSAFLATLLEPKFDDAGFVQARAAFVELLKQQGVEFSSPSPTDVQLEYLCIDLVAVWSPWTLLIENKVASASVTSGQLNRYYNAYLDQIERKVVSDGPICFIYLTPTLNIGRTEFNTLQLSPERGDKAIHIGWDEFLDSIIPILDSNAGRASWFLKAGAARVQEVISAARTASLPDDECRSRLQTLMNALRGQVQKCEDFNGLIFRRWSDRVREQLFASGPARTAYVGVYLSYAATEFPSASSIKAVGDITFELARKHRARLRAIVESKKASEWAELLGVSNAELHVDIERGSISWRFSLPETTEEYFADLAMNRLAVFSSVFASLLHEATEREVVQPDVALKIRC